ncbi:RNA-directed DNA polymerase from mobile element jockey-like [Plakobranchus ocellatus]|uniref:RNA-directed DNA polymerase from mobile element jockey-like n=1 Tax=Plakobranchus ocellatus TaxID=259542 RepID=A0AAV4DXJ8_9GAST|nr:RNA-directed DNA polymerase from mobile element jockey-like [Plakobranchus ocellatus]
MKITNKESKRWAPQPTHMRTDRLRRKRTGTEKLEMSNGRRRRLPKRPQRTSSLNIMQINVQGCKTLRHTQVRKLLSKRDIHVVLAQETLLGKDKEYTLPGYEVFRCDCHTRGKACRGIATFIRKDMRAKVTNNHNPSGSDTQSVEVWRTIIAGDANAHHQAFGYENADAVGQWLVDLTGSSNLTSLVTERSDPTFLHSKGGQYRPDVALVSSDLVEAVRREVLEEVGSDHLPSLISISSPSTARTKISAKWCFKKANWEVFRKTLDRTLEGKDMDNISIDVANDFFARAVIEAARRGVPRGVVRQYIPKITQELALAIKRRREARRTYVKNPLPINKKRYNALCRRARKVGQATKIKAWHDTCEKLDTNSDPRRTWNMIRVLEGKRTTARVEPLEYKGNLMQTDRKEAEAFSHYYAKTSKVQRTPKHDNKVRKQRQEWERKPTVSAQTFTVEFTRTELDAALEKGTNGKAPGLDGVTQEMLTNISLNAKEVLLKLLNRTWTSGVLPRAWRMAVLVPMLKKGCEPLGLRREVQTVKTLEKYLRMEAGSTLRGMAENYNAQKRRLQKESVLSAAYKYAPKFRLSSDRAPLPTPCWAPEEAPAPPEIRADIGWLGKKSDAIPSALKTLALEKVSSLDSSYAICYTDGSAENGIGKGGYGVLYQWPDGMTTREAGSLQNPTTYGQVVQSLGRKLVTLWRAASTFNDDTRCHKFYEAFSAKDYNRISDRVDAVQLFRIRAGHSLLGSDMARTNWTVSADCLLCGEYKNGAHVLLNCSGLREVRPPNFSNLSLQDAIWGGPENAKISARLLRTFFRRALK